MGEKLSRAQQRHIDQQVGETFGSYKCLVQDFKQAIGEKPPTDFTASEKFLGGIRNRHKRLATVQIMEYAVARLAAKVLDIRTNF